MSNIRQDNDWDRFGEDEDAGRPVIAVAHDRPADFEVPAHSHFRAQLVYAPEGVMRVRTDTATWIVPPQQAVWVPPGVKHSVINESAIAFRTLYLHPNVSSNLFEECCVLNIPALLRELILYIGRPAEAGSPDLQKRLMMLVPELLASLEPEPLQLPLPRDRRLRNITDALLDNPADNRGLKDWTTVAGASERTLERLFRSELGMGFQQWRQLLRLLTAVTLLSEGMQVTTVAVELGYASPSAFIAMFRSRMGKSPGQYLQSQKKK